MWFNNNQDYGYSRGGLDVVTAVNLFFKFVLLSPVFLFALYITLAMLKHMIFQGVPSMNKPTEAQVESIRRRDQELPPTPTLTPTPPVRQPTNFTQVTVPSRPEPETPYVRTNYPMHHPACRFGSWEYYNVKGLNCR
jgi:hypothetical protein